MSGTTLIELIDWLKKTSVLTPFPEHDTAKWKSLTREPFLTCLDPYGDHYINHLLFYLQGELVLINWYGLMRSWKVCQPDDAWIQSQDRLLYSSYNWSKGAYDLTKAPEDLTNYIKEHR